MNIVANCFVYTHHDVNYTVEIALYTLRKLVAKFLLEEIVILVSDSIVLVP